MCALWSDRNESDIHKTGVLQHRKRTFLQCEWELHEGKKKGNGIVVDVFVVAGYFFPQIGRFRHVEQQICQTLRHKFMPVWMIQEQW